LPNPTAVRSCITIIAYYSISVAWSGDFSFYKAICFYRLIWLPVTSRQHLSNIHCSIQAIRLRGVPVP
jgi:hypothetical protein